MKLFEDQEQRAQAVMACAGVALHADISHQGLQPISAGPGLTSPALSIERRIAAAFDTAEKFLAEAERRLGP